jgi:hypothetical protein
VKRKQCAARNYGNKEDTNLKQPCFPSKRISTRSMVANALWGADGQAGGANKKQKQMICNRLRNGNNLIFLTSKI